jgi:hypothetical protein
LAVATLKKNPPSFPRAGGLGAMMACVGGETIDRLASLVDSSYELSCILTLAVASSPPGELSPYEMDVLTDLSYRMLINIAEMRETLAQASDQLTTGQN